MNEKREKRLTPRRVLIRTPEKYVSGSAPVHISACIRAWRPLPARAAKLKAENVEGAGIWAFPTVSGGGTMRALVFLPRGLGRRWRCGAITDNRGRNNERRTMPRLLACLVFRGRVLTGLFMSRCFRGIRFGLLFSRFDPAENL